MSEWVVLDITAMTKSTGREKVQKILKAVSLYNKKRVFQDKFTLGWGSCLQDHRPLPKRVQEQAHHIHHGEES